MLEPSGGTMTLKTPIQPCLWFENQAEEAARFYTSVFPNSRMGTITHYGANAPMPEGTVLTVSFELNGQPWTALNGGAAFSFNPAVSFMVICQTQAEVDHHWNALAADPEQGQCGWLTDRYGLSWQIVPQLMVDLLPAPDTPAKQRLMAAMMGMRKLDIAALERAFSQS
jgi:predicted 3-demethylubiquinone-9 3-methyltransferase (glyoxalase superfamily)